MTWGEGWTIQYSPSRNVVGIVNPDSGNWMFRYTLQQSKEGDRISVGEEIWASTNHPDWKKELACRLWLMNQQEYAKKRNELRVPMGKYYGTEEEFEKVRNHLSIVPPSQ